MKKIIAIILFSASLFNMMALSSLASTKEVVVTGDILATIIDVDIPSAASFNIDPNLPEGDPNRYVMPTLNIRNNTTAPVTVKMTRFDNKVGTPNQFIEVARDSQQWDRLGATDSTKYIYLGLIADEGQAAFLNHTSLLSQISAALIQAESKELCHIKSGGTVSLELECQSGSAFRNTITSVYELTFVVSLYEGEEIEEEEEVTEIVPAQNGVITSIIVDGMPNQGVATVNKDHYVDVANPATSRVTITTSTEDTTYLVNGFGYKGSQTLNMHNLPWSNPGAYYLEVIYQYDNKDVRIRYIQF